MKILTFVSGNVNKVSEVSKLLENIPNFEMVTTSIDLPEYQEEMITISNLKAMHGYNLLKKPIFVEDSSLCFSALNCMPGPYIKWFLESESDEKLQRLQSLRKMLIGFNNFEATAVTIVTVYDPEFDAKPMSFIGKCSGRIVDPRGPLTFGWDAVFEPTDQDINRGPLLTYAEMDKAQKNAISHRSKAFALFRDFLTNKYCDIESVTSKGE